MIGRSSTLPLGLLAGGMNDGTISLWDPSKIMSNNPQSLLNSTARHQGAVPALQFHPLADSSHLLASGGVDSEVFIISCERPDAPSHFVPVPPNIAKHTAEVTK